MKTGMMTVSLTVTVPVVVPERVTVYVKVSVIVTFKVAGKINDIFASLTITVNPHIYTEECGKVKKVLIPTSSRMSMSQTRSLNNGHLTAPHSDVVDVTSINLMSHYVKTPFVNRSRDTITAN